MVRARLPNSSLYQLLTIIFIRGVTASSTGVGRLRTDHQISQAQNPRAWYRQCAELDPACLDDAKAID
jgi:hypothetical protein